MWRRVAGGHERQPRRGHAVPYFDEIRNGHVDIEHPSTLVEHHRAGISVGPLDRPFNHRPLIAKANAGEKSAAHITIAATRFGFSARTAMF
jgi:hypothetical protein